MIKLSVLLPVYKNDSPSYLSKAITSLLDSKDYIDELILVEDGPVPEHLSAVYREYVSCSNFTVLSLNKNHGLAYALNKGLALCKNDYVARMDSDDISSPDRFKSQIDFLVNHPSVDILGTAVNIIDEYDVLVNSRTYPCSNDAIVKNIWKCPIAHPSVVYKKSKILSVGGYNTDLKRRQDYDLWFRCAIAGMEFANLSSCLLDYRHTSLSYKKSNLSLALKQVSIAYNWMPILKSPFYAYILVLFPVVKSLLPNFMKIKLDYFKNLFFSRL